MLVFFLFVVCCFYIGGAEKGGFLVSVDAAVVFELSRHVFGGLFLVFGQTSLELHQLFFEVIILDLQFFNVFFLLVQLISFNLRDLRLRSGLQ